MRSRSYEAFFMHIRFFSNEQINQVVELSKSKFMLYNLIMNPTFTKSQQNIRSLLYFILAATVMSNFFITYFDLSFDKSIVLGIQILISLTTLIIASVYSIINWKSFSIYLIIAVVLFLIVYFRK
jgi:hypothetical protein